MQLPEAAFGVLACAVEAYHVIGGNFIVHIWTVYSKKWGASRFGRLGLRQECACTATVKIALTVCSLVGGGTFALEFF